LIHAVLLPLGGVLLPRRQPRTAHIGIDVAGRQDFPTESMMGINSAGSKISAGIPAGDIDQIFERSSAAASG
jgi:hypothetical protein